MPRRAANGTFASIESELSDEEKAYIDGDGAGEQTGNVDEAAPEAPETASTAPEAGVGIQDEPQAGQGPVDGSEKPSKMVPHGRFHQERERARVAEERLQSEAVARARAEERLAMIQAWAESQQKAQTDQQNAPPDDSDPFAVINWLKTQRERDNQTYQQTIQQLQQQVQSVQQGHQAFMTDQQAFQAFNSDLAAAANEVPDFNAACNFLYKQRTAEYMAMGLTQDQIAATAQAELRQITDLCRANGIRPAAKLYELALTRGWKAPEAQAEAPVQANGQGNGAQAPAAQKIARVAKGQASNKSLSGVGAGVSTGAVDANTLASMPMRDFEKWLAKNGTEALMSHL